MEVSSIRFGEEVFESRFPRRNAEVSDEFKLTLHGHHSCQSKNNASNKLESHFQQKKEATCSKQTVSCFVTVFP